MHDGRQDDEDDVGYEDDEDVDQDAQRARAPVGQRTELTDVGATRRPPSAGAGPSVAASTGGASVGRHRQRRRRHSSAELLTGHSLGPARRTRRHGSLPFAGTCASFPVAANDREAGGTLVHFARNGKEWGGRCTAGGERGLPHRGVAGDEPHPHVLRGLRSSLTDVAALGSSVGGSAGWSPEAH